MIVEDAVLGSILKQPFLINETDLTPDHFTKQESKAILTAMKKLNGEGKSIDLVSILMTGDPNSFGGAANLQRIQAAANPIKFDDHVEIILEHWRVREKDNILHNAKEEQWDVERIKTELDRLASNKADDRNAINDLLAEVFEAPWTKRVHNPGTPSGIDKIDNVTGGWQDSDLIILAARPSMGKTDVMLNFAKQAGWHDRLPIIFSLEMPASRLRDRLIASVGGYNRGKFKDLEQHLSAKEKDRWTQAVGQVGKTNIQIYDKPRQTIAEMRMKIRKSMNDFPDKKPIIFVDYLTLIKPAEWMGGNMHLQVSEISKSLKGIAKEFTCPVICLAQLSRAVEQRADKRPMLSDLRESGSIEEDADVVVFIYRDGYYSQNEMDMSMELIFAKHRNGETGSFDVKYNKASGELFE